MVGRNPDVRGAFAKHAHQRGEHSAHGSYLLPGAILHFGQSVVVAEKLVGTVDQVHFHSDQLNAKAVASLLKSKRMHLTPICLSKPPTNLI